MDEHYRAFISYSHAADGTLAAALQHGLQRLGQPWYRRSIVKIFRDQTSLAASPELWAEIMHHLARSAYFVLMASPQAATSPWVDKELQWWLANRSAERLLIVVTGGDIVWDAQSRDFDWQRSTSLPPALRGRFNGEPLYVDLRWTRARHFSAGDPRFRDALLTLGAPLHGRPKDELDSEEIRQLRRMRYAAASVMLALATLGPATLYGLWQAREQSALAALNWREAESRHLAANAVAKATGGDGVHDAIVVALMAWRLAPTDEALRALATIDQASSGMARILGRHTRGVAALAFSDDSTRFATRGKDGSVLVWRTVDWTQDGGLLPGGRSNASGCGGSHPSCNVAAVSFSPTGSHLLAWDRAGAMEFWDLRTRASRTVSDFERPGAVLRSAAIRTDGALVAVGGDAGLLAAWEPSSGQLRRAPGSLSDWDVTGVHFAPDGRVLALASKHHAGARLAVWQVAAGQLTLGPPAELPQGDRYAEVVSFNPSGTRVLMLGHIRSTLAEAAPGGRLRDLVAGTRDFSADRASLALDGRVVFAQYSLDKWRQWDFGSTAPVVVAEGSTRPPWTKLSWSPDARWRVEQDGEEIRVWAVEGRTASGPAKVIDGSCDFAQRADECIRQLCAKVAPSLDETRLLKLFGIRDSEVMYERYRSVVGAALCN